MANEEGDDMEVDDQNRDILESQVKQIEQEIRDVKTKLYQQKVNDIRKELEQVQDGSHAELVAKGEELLLQKEKRLAAAQISRELTFESIDRVYEAEENLAILQYEQNREDLYNAIMSRLQGDIDLCERDRKERDQKAPSSTQDKQLGRTRAPRTLRQPQPLSPTTMVVPDQKVTAATGRPIIIMLSESKIENDLKDMKNVLRQQARQTSKGSSQQSEMFEAVYVDGALVYNKKIFQLGDHIWVESQTGRYTGVITAISSADILVKRGQSPNKKLFISGLRYGKYKIRRCTTTKSK